MSARVAATITLHSGGMGDASEADYDAWVAYVTERIGAIVPDLDVTVEQAPYGEGGDDVPRWCDERDELRAALAGLWESFCADDSAWPAKAVQS